MSSMSLLLIGALVGAAIAATVFYILLKKGKDVDYIALIKAWLDYAVIIAESKYGSGTGKLKFAYVYSQFAEKFPQWAVLVSEEQFNELINKAIEKMNSMFKNEAIDNIVNGNPIREDNDITE